MRLFAQSQSVHFGFNLYLPALKKISFIEPKNTLRRRFDHALRAFIFLHNLDHLLNADLVLFIFPPHTM